MSKSIALCSIFSMRSTASMPPSRVPKGRTEMAKSIARFLVAVMAVAAMALASAVGTGLAQAQTNTPTDRAALAVLHNATDGPNWNINTNWLSDRPIGEWHGVTTNSNGRVIKLELFSNQLTGEIPPELGGLTSLQELSLWGNELTGTIPVELGNLTSLTILYLFSNQLTGPIPTELGNLTSLQELVLSGNQLTGPIPTELGNLSNLESLYLRGNQLTGEIPDELGNLSNLEGLDLSANQLTGEIPDPIGQPVQPRNLGTSLRKPVDRGRYRMNWVTSTEPAKSCCP